jgi:predicted nuclease of restriction endonuclease-like (RecB) superfamily
LGDGCPGETDFSQGLNYFTFLHYWGKSIVKNLSSDLQKEFPGIKGFSPQNLWYMRQFYLEYKEKKKLQPLVGEISWTKNVIIMSRCKDDQQKEFYLKMTKKFGWTKDVLIHQIENQSYEKYLLNQTNFDRAVPEKYRLQAKLAVKDEYTFDFLELGEEHSERGIEIEILKNIRKFLIEMGGYFTFVGNQYKLQVGEKEFFIDLLLYHRKLLNNKGFSFKYH